jgi:hypothetical protein
MTQIAASIEYEVVPTPAGLPNDVHPLPGVSLRFLSSTPHDFDASGGHRGAEVDRRSSH